MTLPCGFTESEVDVERLARSMIADILNMGRTLQAWAAALNAGGQLTSTDVAARWQMLASLRARVETSKGSPGLGGAYARSFQGYSAANLNADWNALRFEIDAVITWLVNNYPEKTVDNKFAFHQAKPGTQELEGFDISITSQQRATLVGLLQAVVAALR